MQEVDRWNLLEYLAVQLIGSPQSALWSLYQQPCYYVQAIRSPSSSSTSESGDTKAPQKPGATQRVTNGDRAEGGSGTAPKSNVPIKGFVEQMPDMTLPQCCTSINFWLLFLTCSIGGVCLSSLPVPFQDTLLLLCM